MTPLLLLLTFPTVYSVCVSLSNTVMFGYYLQNNLFGMLKKPSLFDCAASCQAHVECLSFGFEPRKRLCHLHGVDTEDDPDELVPADHWIHGDLYDLPLDLWGPCADHKCTAGQKCTTNRVTRQAVCVKGDFVPKKGPCPSNNGTDKNGITVECMYAICKVETGCKPPNFYNLESAYYTDCYEPGNDLESCAASKNCSDVCVRAYMTRYGSWCTGGRTPTCEDYARIHQGGIRGCQVNTTLGYWEEVRKHLNVCPEE